ncbi:MAG TPA: hypothetical protein VKB76_15375, partial [Ktedonobacterales bacterium]|nr:hypothetical protein [Ktedonobacterales bacterium]
SNCNNNQPCATLSYQDSTGATHQLTDSNGVAVDPTAEHITSGDALTVHGKRWDPNTAFQVWLSAPFVDLSKEPSNNECYVRVDASANPNADGSFTRSIALPDLDPTTFPNGAYFTLEVGSPGIGCLNSDQVGNSEELGEDAEVNSYEVSFKAYAKPPAPPCTVGQNSPCLTVAPGVVYPGKPVTVTGQGWSGSSVALFLSAASTTGTPSDCTVQAGSATVSGGNFSTTILAPPLPTLPPVNATGNALPTQFQVVAVAPPPTSGCTGTQTKAAALYVSPPTLNVPTDAHSGDSITITGVHWAASGGNGSTAPKAVNVAVLLGTDSSFSCSSAHVKTTTSNATDPNDGSFTVTFDGINVDKQTTEQVRAIALPSGASAASLCDSAAPGATSCQQAQDSGSQCPLMAVTTTFNLLPATTPGFSWIYLIPAALLLLLLPLFFWLGRRDEDEVIITEQDIERDLASTNVAVPSQYAGATFVRMIRVTRSVVNMRTGKVKDQEIQEYDVFLDAQGKEVRRLRQPGKATPAPTPTPPPPAQPATGTATS